MRLIVSFLSFFVAVSATRADEKPAAMADIQVMAPYIDDLTVAIFHSNLDQINTDAALELVLKTGATLPEQMDASKKKLLPWLKEFRQAGGRDIYAFMSLADFPNGEPFAIVPIRKNADVAALRKLFESFGSTVEKRGDALFAGSKRTRDRIDGMKPSPRPDLAKAIEAAGPTLAQAFLVPSADTRRSIRESLPTLPKEIGGGSTAVLIDGVRWAALGMDAPPNGHVKLYIQSKDAQTAAQLQNWIGNFWRMLAQHKATREAVPEIKDWGGWFTPKANGDHLTLDLSEDKIASALAPAVRQVRRANTRMVSINNLKQIGLALHSYHDVHNTFPPGAIYSKDGKPLLSWRVAILPYIEQDNLYKQFKLDEPWDSEHNKKLLAKMPQVFKADPNGPATKTVYLGISGADGMFPPGPKGVRVRDVTDGLSNTIFAVEVNEKHAVPWTKPEDYNYDPKDPLGWLKSRPGGTFAALMGDGSVMTISEMVDPNALLTYFTRSGGEARGELTPKK